MECDVKLEEPSAETSSASNSVSADATSGLEGIQEMTDGEKDAKGENAEDIDTLLSDVVLEIIDKNNYMQTLTKLFEYEGIDFSPEITSKKDYFIFTISFRGTQLAQEKALSPKTAKRLACKSAVKFLAQHCCVLEVTDINASLQPISLQKLMRVNPSTENMTEPEAFEESYENTDENYESWTEEAFYESGDALPAWDTPSAEERDSLNSFALSNKGFQMMLKMGWTGGSLGKEEQKEIVRPFDNQVVSIKRTGLGIPHKVSKLPHEVPKLCKVSEASKTSNPPHQYSFEDSMAVNKPSYASSLQLSSDLLAQMCDPESEEFLSAIETIITKYVESEEWHPIAFPPEICNLGRKAIHQYCLRFDDLQTKSYGKEDRFLVVKKYISAYDLFEIVDEQGGEYRGYKTYWPGEYTLC